MVCDSLLMTLALESLHRSARDQTMTGIEHNPWEIGSRQHTCRGRRRHPQHARATWRTSDTPAAPMGLGKERPRARRGDRLSVRGLGGQDARLTVGARTARVAGVLVVQIGWASSVAGVAASGCRGRRATAAFRPPVAGHLGQASTAINRLAASHVFASLKRLGQGFAPTPRGGLRCAQPARNPRVGEGAA